MPSHFLTNIEIKQFKCFSDFHADGFRRVNFISGKNNVGKTAFMEALYINVSSLDISHMITAIVDIKFSRESINLLEKRIDNKYLLDATKYYSSISNIGEKKFHIKTIDGKKECFFKIDDDSRTINFNEINVSFDRAYGVKLIDNFGWFDSQLIVEYSVIQRLDKESELNSYINAFDHDIENFKIIGDKPQCKVKGEYREITEFGDGLKHYISIICALYAAENGYLFVDEIDNGIHYTQLDRLWELILTLSKKTNCQVFATTHSKEMLESFARVSQKLEEQDISFTTLVKDKTGEIKALTRDYEMLIDSIAQDREVRGW